MRNLAKIATTKQLKIQGEKNEHVDNRMHTCVSVRARMNGREFQSLFVCKNVRTYVCMYIVADDFMRRLFALHLCLVI